MNAASSFLHMRIAQQCFGLFPKLREVDAFMTTERQQAMYEVHPELCFYELAGRRPMRQKKKTRGGIDERRAALVGAVLLDDVHFSDAFRFSGAGVDDALDAYAACWTAERIMRGAAVRIPLQAPLDSKGLRMEMWR